MKRVISIWIIILFVIAGCKQSTSQSNDIITIDVTKSYSSKKELILQDFMDVEYIALETNDDFVNQGFVMDIGKKFILIRNRTEDGNIYIYDRHGKAIRKINHKGQGGEEYINIFKIILDEENEEMFVNDIYARKIIVYDLYGNFKRSFKHKEGSGSIFYTDIFNYDSGNLICFDELNEEIPFLLVSKQDGSITQSIQPPFKEKLLHIVFRDYENNRTLAAGPGHCRPIIPSYDGHWILSEASSDTIYTLMPDYSLRPFIARTPSVQSMEPEIFLVLRLISNRYYFMEAVKKEYDFESESGFPKTYFVYDTQEKAIFNYTIYNGDFSTKKEIYMSITKPVNHEIESWYPLEADQLVEAYKKGELKGKLKEIAATLDEDSNPVIMLIKHKK